MAPSEIPVRNEEIRTAREVVREFGATLGLLSSGDLEKVVVVTQGKMRGVLLSPERYAALLERQEPRP